MRRTSVLLFSALWLILAPSSAYSQSAPADHLTCYKLDDPLDAARYTADLDGPCRAYSRAGRPHPSNSCTAPPGDAPPTDTNPWGSVDDR